jgi:putative polyketide hydroxylase
MTSARVIDVPVLIVGGGPAGLCASILLSRHGIESLLVEKHPGTSIYPRATGINIRSMEIFRSLGLQAEIGRASFKAEPRIAFSSVLTDAEPNLSPSFHPDHLDVSPAAWTSCSQKELEPILLRAARSDRLAQLMFGTELLSFDETSNGITAQIGDRMTGRLREVQCRYLIAADGSKSPVREGLGVRMLGPGVLNHNISIHFSAHLERHMPLGPNFLHFVQNEDVTGMFVATDGRSRWVFAIPYDPEHGESAGALTAERAVDLVRKGAGVAGLDVEVVGIVPWRMEADCAERWRVGNVFLAGDAAHRMTPAGGLGMNTAIQDVHNLCWKLAAVLQGWAGADVLDTYEAERRPVAQQNVQRSVALITGAGGAGDRSALDFDLGSTYESTAVFAGTEAARATAEYIPVARPGSRAPHVWLSAGRDRLSTLDVFGPRLTLLAGPGDEAWRMDAIEIAAELGVKMQYRTAACSGTDRHKWEAAYGVAEGGAVLIRPDGHVAWRRASAVPDPAGELRLVLNSVLGLRRDSRVAAPHSRRLSATA